MSATEIKPLLPFDKLQSTGKTFEYFIYDLLSFYYADAALGLRMNNSNRGADLKSADIIYEGAGKMHVYECKSSKHRLSFKQIIENFKNNIPIYGHKLLKELIICTWNDQSPDLHQREELTDFLNDSSERKNHPIRLSIWDRMKISDLAARYLKKDLHYLILYFGEPAVREFFNQSPEVLKTFDENRELYHYYKEVMLYNNGDEYHHRSVYGFPVEKDFEENKVYSEDIDVITSALDRAKSALFMADEGRGKTTLARRLAYEYHRKGYQVIFIDAEDLKEKDKSYQFLKPENLFDHLIIVDNGQRNIDLVKKHIVPIYQDYKTMPDSTRKMLFFFLSRKLDDRDIFQDKNGEFRDPGHKDKKYWLPLIEHEEVFADNLIRKFIQPHEVNDFKNKLPKDPEALNENTNIRLIQLFIGKWEEYKNEPTQGDFIDYVENQFRETYRLSKTNLVYEKILLSIASVACFDIPYVSSDEEVKNYNDALNDLIDRCLIRRNDKEYRFPHPFDAYFLLKAFYKKVFGNKVSEHLLTYLIPISGRKSENLPENIRVLFKNMGMPEPQNDYYKFFQLLDSEFRNNSGEVINLIRMQPILINYYLIYLSNAKQKDFAKLFWDQLIRDKEIRQNLIESSTLTLAFLVVNTRHLFGKDHNIMDDLKPDETEVMAILDKCSVNNQSSLQKALKQSGYSSDLINQWLLDRKSKEQEQRERRSEILFNIKSQAEVDQKIKNSILVIYNRFVNDLYKYRTDGSIERLIRKNQRFIYTNIDCKHLGKLLNLWLLPGMESDGVDGDWDKPYFAKAIGLIKKEPEKILRAEPEELSKLIYPFKKRYPLLVKELTGIREVKNRIIQSVSSTFISARSKIDMLIGFYCHDQDDIRAAFHALFAKGLSPDEKAEIIKYYKEVILGEYKGQLPKNGLFDFICTETGIIPTEEQHHELVDL